jgi:hypothetical protein
MGGRDIAEAWLTQPVTRYRHFVLGSAYEAMASAARRGCLARLARMIGDNNATQQYVD